MIYIKLENFLRGSLITKPDYDLEFTAATQVLFLLDSVADTNAAGTIVFELLLSLETPSVDSHFLQQKCLTTPFKDTTRTPKK